MAYSVRQMAELLGVSKSQVARDKGAGMPMESVDAARAWRMAQHDMSRTSEGRIDRPAGAPDMPAAPGAGLAAELGGPAHGLTPDDEPDAPADADTSEYRAARAQRERTNAERAQIELAQLRGQLIQLEQAKRLAFTAFRTLRDAVLNVPARVKDQCAAETDSLVIEQLLEAELAAALGSFSPDKVLTDADDDDDDAD